MYFFPVTLAESIFQAKLFVRVELDTQVDNKYTYTQYSSLINLSRDVSCVSKVRKKSSQIALKIFFLKDSCYFKSLTVDCLLTLFLEKNTFRNKARAIKLTEIKVLATVTTKPSVVCGKLHKY